MVVDGSTFMRRARVFFRELQAKSFPNANSLAKLCGCSKNTAQRTIYRLRDEYMVPIEYNSSEKGYYLKNDSHELPKLLPPGKDELTALLLACELVKLIDADDIKTYLKDFWNQYASSSAMIGRELDPLSNVFSSDITVIGEIADRGLIPYVGAAATGENLRIKYRSPWRGNNLKEHEGRILKVHYGDGSLYLLFLSTKGRQFILNASFIKSYEILNHDIEFEELDEKTEVEENWLEGFGIWTRDDLVECEITILPPASHFYAAKRWHVEQIDSWDGENLVRKVPAIISPEIVRKILGLGRFIGEVKPKALKDLVLAEITEMASNVTP